MLYRRTSTDTAPVGAVSQRALRAVRTACDAAPASDAVSTEVLAVEHDLGFWEPFEAQFESTCLIGARGPPGRG